MKLPDGFSVTLFAGEPDVVQPIAFTFDDRGRLWVVECRSYPKWIKDDKTPGDDSILVFEDTDHDGKFDKRTVFAERLKNVSAIELGFGGVWLGAVPNLEFIPADINADAPKPTGPMQILLDGWNLNEVKHNIFSSFTWGPDGWLWATNGIQSKSKIGKPGTPDAERVKFDCGVWRYHPTKHLFEVVAVGTTNPWGLDFDEYGQCFITNCVIAHLWHVIPGAYYERMYGQHFNPYHYGYMKTCADHLHWETGKTWTESRNGLTGKTSEAGGGHAHIGAMIYQGESWPAQYRNSIFTCNLHGNRINNDVLEPKGSGYVGRHGADFLMANDPWFRGLCIKQSPDGSAFVSDWTDTGECHNYDKVDPSNGRIYKIAYKSRPVVNPAMGQIPDMGLCGVLADRNDWTTRHARRLLQERASAGKLAPEVIPFLTDRVFKDRDAPAMLRALWHLYAAGGVTDELLLKALDHKESYLRGWAIRLAVEERNAKPALLKRFAELAANDPSPVVRLHLASALQRIAPADRWPIAEALVQHAEDATDANLPLMAWFAIEPLVPADMTRALALAQKSKFQIVNQYIARRAADGPNKQGIDAVVAVLGKSNDHELNKWLLNGLHEALAGLRNADMPAGWNDVYAHLQKSPRGEVRDGSTRLALMFGDKVALTELRKQAADKNLDDRARSQAIQSLVNAKDPEIAKLLHKLLDDRQVRPTVIRGLAAVGNPESPQQLISRYAKLDANEKTDAIQTLVSRPPYAIALLDAVGGGQIPKADLNAYTVRQIAGMNDSAVKAKLKEVWGDVRPPEKDKLARIKALKKELTPEVLKQADLSNGRAIYTKTCAACHTLFDAGGKVGPNLTGSQRAVLDYTLENIIDPSAQVANEYRVTVIDTKDDRRIEGIIIGETEKTLTLRTTTEEISLPKTEVVKRRTSPLSMMPEGLIDAISPQERRDLIGYLASPQQVPEKKDSGSPRP
jgi:putative membrane-bound dehydrogenase-like protein